MGDNQPPMRRVLVADDKAFVRGIITRVLRQCNTEVVGEAAGGREALEMLRSASPRIDILVLDLLMPDMDGIEVVRHLTSFKDKPAIIFVTGSDPALLSIAERVAKARGLDILGSVEKPVTAHSMGAALDRYGVAQQKSAQTQGVTLTAADLQTALDERQLVLHYQPKISIQDNRLIGFESLVRWKHPQLGLIFPDKFINLAEKSGLIGPLTEQVFETSVRQCSAWRDQGLDTTVSVNLSAFMLTDLSMPDTMAALVRQHDGRPEQITLEVTESGIFQDEADTLEILARFRMKKFPLSIDDFGTGYSSLDQLRQVPFSELKIDRAFVSGATDNRKALQILEGSIELARKLGLKIVAEGAENEHDMTMLRTAGVDIVQGYGIAKPMFASDATAWAVDWSSRHSSA